MQQVGFLTLSIDKSTKMQAVITIPVLMLWNIRISWKKKLALMTIFSLTVIVIIVSIVRITLVNTKYTGSDISWLHMWSNIETAVCTFFFPHLFFIMCAHHPVYDSCSPLEPFHSYCGLLPCLIPAAFRQIGAVWPHPKRQLPTSLGQGPLFCSSTIEKPQLVGQWTLICSTSCPTQNSLTVRFN